MPGDIETLEGALVDAVRSYRARSRDAHEFGGPEMWTLQRQALIALVDAACKLAETLEAQSS